MPATVREPTWIVRTFGPEDELNRGITIGPTSAVTAPPPFAGQAAGAGYRQEALAALIRAQPASDGVLPGQAGNRTAAGLAVGPGS
jgi:hypothetical protein